jgi:hypothetical protein
MKILGELNFVRGRVQGYFAFVAFLQTTYLSLNALGISLWWMLLLIPTVAFIAWFDLAKIYPSESDIGTRKNPKLMSMSDKIDKILTLLEKK